MSLKTFGSMIREHRETHRLTLREVAQMMEVDISLLSKIEKNKRPASKDFIRKFSSIFELDEKELIVASLSDKVAYEIADELFPSDILKAAEEKVNYFKTKRRT